MSLLSALCERSDFKLVHLNSRSHYGEMEQLQSALNDDYKNFQEKSNTYRISEPIVGRFFPNLVLVRFPASRGPFSFVFAELTDGTKKDLCHGSKLPLIQPPSMVVDGGFRNACSLYCLLTAT